jgi:hypothetical protein
MPKYSQLFAKGLKKKEVAEAVTAGELSEKWNAVSEKAMEVSGEITDEDVSQLIYTMPGSHPFVNTLLDSISWNIKHTMWHCGQTGIVKRVVDQPIDFGM